MLIKMTTLPEAGTTFTLDLEFQQAGTIPIDVEVRDVGAMGGGE
jgi:copper(I)-binding protein